MRAALGMMLYLLLAFAPLLLMLLSPAGPGREPLREFAVALGFVAIGIFAMQFVLSARLGRLKAPYGIDAVLHFHRRIALLALGLVVAHPLLLIVVTPSRIELLNVFTAPWRARFAVAAVVLAGAIVATSLWRERFGLQYETWRVWHNAFSSGILLFASLHIAIAGIYTVSWKIPAFVIYVGTWAALLGYAHLAKPLLKRRHPYRVAEVRAETPDTWTLSVRPDGHRGLRFRPGQFAWFQIGLSSFSFEEHPFSFSSSPLEGDGGFDITVKELGDFTATIGETKPGDVVYVDGPFGAFTTDRYPAASYAFIAGGVGITPVMSQLRTAALRGSTTPTLLVYGATTLEDLAFADELDRLAETLELQITYVLEKAPTDWNGERGFITPEVLARVLGDPARHEYFICGPPAMTDAVERSLIGLSVPRKRLHYERFGLV